MVNERHAENERADRTLQRAQGRVVQMTEREDLRERVAVLESQGEHMSKKIDSMDKKLAEVHEILVAARGARWFLFAMVGVGGFIAGKLGSVAPGIFK
jgi:hypothetical protein